MLRENQSSKAAARRLFRGITIVYHAMVFDIFLYPLWPTLSYMYGMCVFAISPICGDIKLKYKSLPLGEGEKREERRKGKRYCLKKR